MNWYQTSLHTHYIFSGTPSIYLEDTMYIFRFLQDNYVIMPLNNGQITFSAKLGRLGRVLCKLIQFDQEQYSSREKGQSKTRFSQELRRAGTFKIRPYTNWVLIQQLRGEKEGHSKMNWARVSFSLALRSIPKTESEKGNASAPA